MKYTRIYSDPSGESHFEDVQVSLQDRGIIGFLSEKIPVSSMQFRENEAGYDWDFHNAPERQFIILLDGETEITASDGETRIFRGGDILLVEDTGGKGHRSKHIKQQIRKSIFIQL